MQLKLSEIEKKYLDQQFPNIHFSLYQSTDIEHFISCFVARVPNQQSCKDNWLNITTEIAINFQAALTSELASWNIYLVFICPEQIDKHLKYQIENNRFALRKIVLVSKIDETMWEQQILGILGRTILGDDLELGSVLDLECDIQLTTTDENFIRRALTNVSKIPLDGKEKSIQIRRKKIEELLAQVTQI
ncbi:hypothetical protein PUZ93_001309 [Cronobacter turicensis]|nr:hypothetical protein [Cronobacter turicensis]